MADDTLLSNRLMDQLATHCWNCLVGEVKDGRLPDDSTIIESYVYGWCAGRRLPVRVYGDMLTRVHKKIGWHLGPTGTRLGSSS